MDLDYADRLKKLPPYLFEEIDKAKKKAEEEGRPIIDLGVGDPDQPTPDFVIKKLQEAVLDPATHQYALNRGLKNSQNLTHVHLQQHSGNLLMSFRKK
jgi:LL-diaminopimelate aminotransferase